MVQNVLNPGADHQGAQARAGRRPNVREMKDTLQRLIGLKVSIEDHNGRGKVIIEYSRLEDFDTLLERLNAK